MNGLAYPTLHAWDRIRERLGNLSIYDWVDIMAGAWPATDAALKLFNVIRFDGYQYHLTFYRECPVLVITDQERVITVVTYRNGKDK